MAYTTGWVQVLQVDQDLAARLPGETVAEAAPFAFAATEWLAPGEWRPLAPAPDERSGHLGLLIVDGFLARRVHVLDRPVTELLGRGDLLIPWEPDRTHPFASGARWEVLEPTRLAVLDERFTALVGRWPGITVALVGRAVSRSRSFALSLAIGQLVGIDLRVLAMLWHVGDRWGTDEPDGVLLPVRLTHEMLASLVSAQRPTVTRALGALAERGELTRRDDGLLVLHGSPPAQFRRETGPGDQGAAMRRPAGRAALCQHGRVSTTRIRQTIRAPRGRVYAALIDPAAVARWRVPAGMTSEVHEFDAREDGAVRVSLTYEAPDRTGKTVGRTDTYRGRFVTLVPDELVVEVDEFETDDPALRGEMKITIRLEDVGGATELVAAHEGLPPGVSEADNETGWREALARLAALVESSA